MWRVLKHRTIDTWNLIMGPPRVKERPDGYVTVSILGRRFEASNRAILFEIVGREREQLLRVINNVNDGYQQYPVGVAYLRTTETRHREAQRLSDRLALYNEFLAALGKELDGA